MPNKNTTGIIFSALAIGVIADQLFRAPDFGVNLPIAAALLAVAGLSLPRSEAIAPWPWLASVFFASMWAIRDTESLLAMDLLAALALASLPLLREIGVRLREIGLWDLATALPRAAWVVSVGTFGFLPAVKDAIAVTPSSTDRRRAIGIGALLAAPLVLVFGGLFASADPVFNKAVGSLFDFEFFASHAVVIGAFTWASTGYFWFLAKPSRAPSPLIETPRLGSLQVMIPLLAMVVLFTLFVAVQATSLFGGTSFVESTTRLTYAEYARSGFFELVFASALVLPLVYYAPAVAGPLDQAGAARFRFILVAQLALTGLVLASALWKMGLYVGVYGLTEDRVNGTAIMLWIALTLGVFAFTVVQGRPQRAAFGSLVSAVLVLGALNVVNPSATIAQYNLSRETAREVDFVHLAYLGGDAIAILAENMARVPEADRCRIVTAIRERYVPVSSDWRSWNLARARAHAAALALPPMGACPTEPNSAHATSPG